MTQTKVPGDLKDHKKGLVMGKTDALNDVCSFI
jgi:hypothetical protein